MIDMVIGAVAQKPGVATVTGGINTTKTGGNSDVADRENAEGNFGEPWG
jgi:hypothetical protein